MVCVMEGTLVGFFSRCFGTFEGELREESKDGVEAELALKKYKNVKNFPRRSRRLWFSLTKEEVVRRLKNSS